MRAGRAAFVGLLVLIGLQPASAALDITQCGVTVPPGSRGVLRNDVVCENRCSNDPSVLCGGDDDLCGAGRCIAETITLGPGARLDFGGHLIQMAYQGEGVRCGDASDSGTCTLVGPGSIVGGKGTGVLSPAMDLRIKDLVIEGTDDAIFAGGFVVLRDVRMGGREEQVSAAGGIRAIRVLVGPAGMTTLGDLILRSVEIGLNSGSLTADGKVRGRHVLATGTATISGHDVSLRNLKSMPEPFEDLVRVEAVRRLRLVDSNAGRIESGERPKLQRSSCVQSFVTGAPATWGVCADD